MTQDTWDERDLPILEAVVAAEADNPGGIDRVADLVPRTGLDHQQVLVGVRALKEADFITATDASGALEGGLVDFLGIRPLERGRRATGQWPVEDLGTELVDLLDAQVNAASSEDERTKWERLRNAAADIGKSTLTELLVGFARRVAGIP